jgi:hypothetical protein
VKIGHEARRGMKQGLRSYQGNEWPMADQWVHTGGSALLDALLYDNVLSEAHHRLEGHFPTAPVNATGSERTNVADSAGSP